MHFEFLEREDLGKDKPVPTESKLGSDSAHWTGRDSVSSLPLPQRHLLFQKEAVVVQLRLKKCYLSTMSESETHENQAGNV